MTLSKLSLRNARRQAGDYLVYFVTVVLSAALIHAFNGLVFSQELITLSSLMDNLPVIIILASLMVICVMGWLIHYVTAFMLSRRSRELGTYILVGMENSQVARLFFLENLAVGGAALLLGLPLGGLIFQMLRAIILSLFHVPYTFSLTFSPEAVALTFVYFTAIYLLVLLKSRKRIRKLNIHDLIYFEKRNEEAAVRESRNRRKLFTAAVLSGIIGVPLLLTGSIQFILPGTACAVFFLYGFFLSFSSGVPAYFQKRPGKKYVSHTLLVFRSLSAKLNTMGLTMAAVSLLFTVTLISEGTGMLFANLFQNRVEGSTCFDIFIGTVASQSEAGNSAFGTKESLYGTVMDAIHIGDSIFGTEEPYSGTAMVAARTGVFVSGMEKPLTDTDTGAAPAGDSAARTDLVAAAIGNSSFGDYMGAATGAFPCSILNPESRIESADPQFRPYLEYIKNEIPLRASMQYSVYQGENLQVTDYIDENAEYYGYYDYDPLMAYSDYAALRRMLGYDEAILEPGHYIVHCMSYLGKLMEGYEEPVTAGGARLLPGGVYTEHFAQKMWDGNGRGFILVVPDECLASRPVSHKIYGALALQPLTQEQDDRLQEINRHQQGGEAGLMYYGTGACTLMSKSALAREYAATSACTVFPLYYLALILTMASATILTVQQLGESVRYRRQFVLLGKLGMDRREMARVLNIQLAIYYAMPALPPLFISIPLLWAMGHSFEPGTISGPGQLAGILGTAFGLFFLIYFLYILMTYSSMRKNVMGED